MSFVHVDRSNPIDVTHSVENPLNREDNIQNLISRFLTSNDNAFNRNHGPIPRLSEKEHLLVIDGIVASPLVLGINELATSFSQHDLTCALQCAGNRRNTMGNFMRPVRGVGWNDGAVMNCTWSGVLLRDVLLRAGVTSPFSANSSLMSDMTDRTISSSDDPPDAKDIRDHELHVCFESNCVATQDCPKGFGGSIPLSRAIDPDYEVLLALRMNGEPLPVNHGYPLRVVVPGQLGARSVKWLERITISAEESPYHYQRRDYKVLPESIQSWDEANGTTPGGDGVGVWPILPAFGDMPVNSAVALPVSNSTVARDSDGQVEVKGYALPAGDHGPIAKVEVSTDEGKTWTQARILKNELSNKWCWSLWTVEVKIEKGEQKSVWSRATDAGGNVQPRMPKWNLRGLAYNGYGEARNIAVV